MDIRADGAGIAAVEEVVGEHVVVGGVVGVVSHLELLIVAIGPVVVHVVVVGVVNLEGGAIGVCRPVGEGAAGTVVFDQVVREFVRIAVQIDTHAAHRAMRRVNLPQIM